MTDPAAAPHLRLRAATAAKHDEVDATFARYDLADAESYARLLEAHARILPPIERILLARDDLPAFAPRKPALTTDLAELGHIMPPPVDVPAPASAAAAWGMLYVTEGSRLGGAFLARAVGEGLPRAYFAAAHPRGGWRALLNALDAAAADGGDDWLEEARIAAVRTFDLYAAAADAPGA